MPARPPGPPRPPPSCPNGGCGRGIIRRVRPGLAPFSLLGPGLGRRRSAKPEATTAGRVTVTATDRDRRRGPGLGVCPGPGVTGSRAEPEWPQWAALNFKLNAGGRPGRAANPGESESVLRVSLG